MSSIPFDSEGFVDMGHFDATNPDLVPALSEHGLLDDLPDLPEANWDELFRDVFQSDATADADLVPEDETAPFDEADTDSDDSDVDADPFHLGVGEGDDEDSVIDDDADRGDEADHDDEDTGTDIGSTAGELVTFEDDGADIGSTAGDLVSFGDEDEVDFGTTDFEADDVDLAVDDDLDALENLDFD
jgi:hypothetical protein